jgi:hypothetical protein
LLERIGYVADTVPNQSEHLTTGLDFPLKSDTVARFSRSSAAGFEHMREASRREKYSLDEMALKFEVHLKDRYIFLTDVLFPVEMSL